VHRPRRTTEKVGQWITEAGVSPSEFEVLSNPEFLRQSTAILDFLHPYRIIIGGHSQEQRERLRHIFSPIINQDFPSPIPECSWQISTPVPTLLTTPRTAEMIKYASNAFLATKISYINEVGNICREYGVDVNEVARGMGLDSRISPSFLEAGVGFGGSCLPKDTRALIGMGKTVGYQPKLLEAVLEVNREQPLKMVKLAESRVGDLAHKKVAVLGAAFKAGTDDTRESVAFTVVDELLTKKALPVIYDPMALEKVRQRFGDTIIYAGSAREAIIQCDCVLITTAWEEFRDTTLYDGKVVIDGRSTLSGIDSIEYERIC